MITNNPTLTLSATKLPKYSDHTLLIIPTKELGCGLFNENKSKVFVVLIAADTKLLIYLSALADTF